MRSHSPKAAGGAALALRNISLRFLWHHQIQFQRAADQTLWDGTAPKFREACIRCPSRRLDPAARPRLVEIIANLNDRIAEAKLNGWLGEVAGLKASLEAAARKLVNLDRTHDRQLSGPVDLGIPIITDQ
jgi:hypothetical protein